MTAVAIVFLILLVLNVPLAFCIGVSSLAFFLVTPDVAWITPVQRMVAQTQSFPLLAVPFFVLAGNLMNATGITSRMIRFSTILSGHMRGGLAQVSIVLSTLMGGISGSAVADAAMESRVLGPDMIKRGYSKGFIAAVLAMGGLITATIPPSVGLILYGVTGGVSIGKLFVAGIFPGLLMMVMLMIACGITAKRRGYPRESPTWPSLREVWSGFLESVWALLFPFLLIGGIRFGIFTASEAGAFAVIYAFVVGVFIYREMTVAGFYQVVKLTISDNGVIMFIIMAANIFGYAITFDQVPQTMAEVIAGISSNRWICLLIILVFVFVAGMFVEATVNTLLLTPIFLPIVKNFGFDSVHFGILFMTLVTMGGMTPPVGVTMFATCSILKCPFEDYVRECVPFVVTIVLEVVILTFLPDAVMWLPNLVF
jgi:tripartite ATP-independent transporter DctM subunit